MKLTVRRRLVVPAAAVAVAVAGGGAALVARHGASASTQFRTAVATLGTVTQTISLSGNLAPVGETDLDFGS
ncbi:MAG TPA: RND transporter, partial [Candidatus Dormibacteraeota bacterium]